MCEWDEESDKEAEEELMMELLSLWCMDAWHGQVNVM